MKDLQIKGVEVKMTSLEISEITGKLHKNVLRDIRNEINNLEQRGINAKLIFEPTYYRDANNKQYPMFTFCKKGAMQLALKYDSITRFRVIERIEELENVNHFELPDFTNPAIAARAWAEQFEEKTKALQLVKEQKHLVDFANDVANSSDCINIGTYAKILYGENINLGRNKLFQWLRENKYLMTNNLPYQRFIDMGLFNVIEQTYHTPYGTQIANTTMITGKGQIYLMQKLKEYSMFNIE